MYDCIFVFTGFAEPLPYYVNPVFVIFFLKTGFSEPLPHNGIPRGRRYDDASNQERFPLRGSHAILHRRNRPRHWIHPSVGLHSQVQLSFTSQWIRPSVGLHSQVQLSFTRAHVKGLDKIISHSKVTLLPITAKSLTRYKFLCLICGYVLLAGVSY